MTGEDLTADALAEHLPGRELRSYPAILSTQADAMAWARQGAPAGSVVVADYQVSPRGRGGRPWDVQQGEGLGFSIVLRPDLPPQREGWLYTIAASGVADVVGRGEETAIAGNGGPTRIAWPDEVLRGSVRTGALGIHVELGAGGIQWAVATFLIDGALPPRGPLLRRIVDAVEARARQSAEEVLDDYRPRCLTLGRQLRARLVPLGPAGPQVTGLAVDLRDDGALVLETQRGRVAVPPQNLGDLEEAL
ncbi:MAG: hypothetical protein KY437_04475 [Actinobacteria bacterium]|nr:hypothetical protein [Actinomycetota bacterium]